MWGCVKMPAARNRERVGTNGLRAGSHVGSNVLKKAEDAESSRPTGETAPLIPPLLFLKPR